MTMRPAVRRRLLTVEELSVLVDVDAATLDRRLRGLGHRKARFGGSGWHLSDPAWAALLGPEFVDVIRVGGMRPYRELVAAADVHETAVRQPSGERSRPPKKSLGRRERARIYESGVAALQAAAGLYGEDIEVEL